MYRNHAMFKKYKVYTSRDEAVLLFLQYLQSQEIPSGATILKIFNAIGNRYPELWLLSTFVAFTDSRYHERPEFSRQQRSYFVSRTWKKM